MDVAPPLDGLFDRQIGSYENYPYSDGLSEDKRTWNKQRLVRFLSDPQGAYPGTTMPNAQLGEWEVDAIAEFLATVEASAPPANQG